MIFRTGTIRRKLSSITDRVRSRDWVNWPKRELLKNFVRMRKTKK